jgi:hypothetical protein
MSKIHKLLVLADEYEKLATASEKGEYGGKGEFELPKSHVAAMQVTKGGSCCKNCKYVDAAKHECKNPHYIKWNGDDPKLPVLPLDEICSDWWEPKK